MSKGKARASYLTLGLIVASLATVASASDRKVFPGTFCVRIDTTSQLRYGMWGEAQNTASSAKEIVCPIVRDNTSEDMEISDWDITVNSNGQVDPWSVQLWSLDKGGITGESSYIAVEWWIERTLDGGSLPETFPDGRLQLYAELPPNAYIKRYAITEK